MHSVRGIEHRGASDLAHGTWKEAFASAQTQIGSRLQRLGNYDSGVTDTANVEINSEIGVVGLKVTAALQIEGGNRRLKCR